MCCEWAVLDVTITSKHMGKTPSEMALGRSKELGCYDVDTCAILMQINPKHVPRPCLDHPITHPVALLDDYDVQFGQRSRTFEKKSHLMPLDHTFPYVLKSRVLAHIMKLLRSTEAYKRRSTQTHANKSR